MSQAASRFAGPALRLLLVEDDEGDAVLVRASLTEAGISASSVTWVRTLAEATVAIAKRPHCVLLDLALPDAEGLSALLAMVDASPSTAVIVLTGRNDPGGLDVLAVGAEDYLVKDDVTADLLLRSIRYAIERKRAQVTVMQLREARRASAERARLERGLLPTPLLRTDAVTCASHYRPGRDHAVLGGDFFDVVEVRDGVVRAVVGDVMGHGPDEAALGVHLRVAWRTLILGGTADPEILPTLARLLAAEAAGANGFVTVCDVTIDTAHDTVTMRVAGHPAPLRCQDQSATYLDVAVGPPLGITVNGANEVTAATWPESRTDLQPGSSLMLYTDGLLDAYLDEGDPASVGIGELVAAVHERSANGAPVDTWIPALIASAPNAAADDTAVVVMTTRDR